MPHGVSSPCLPPTGQRPACIGASLALSDIRFSTKTNYETLILLVRVYSHKSVYCVYSIVSFACVTLDNIAIYVNCYYLILISLQLNILYHFILYTSLLYHDLGEKQGTKCLHTCIPNYI